MGGGGADAAYFADVAGDAVAHGHLADEVVVAGDALPPGGLGDDAEVVVDLDLAHAALAHELLVLVGRHEAVGDLDAEDEQGGAVAAGVDGGEVRLGVEHGVVPAEGDEALVGDEAGGEGDDELEAQRGVADEAAGFVEDAAVAGVVVQDGVAEGGDDGEPADYEAEGCDFEADVCCVWLGAGGGLVWGALLFDLAPVAGDDEEDVLGVVSLGKLGRRRRRDLPAIARGSTTTAARTQTCLACRPRGG